MRPPPTAPASMMRTRFRDRSKLFARPMPAARPRSMAIAPVRQTSSALLFDDEKAAAPSRPAVVPQSSDERTSSTSPAFGRWLLATKIATGGGDHAGGERQPHDPFGRQPEAPAPQRAVDAAVVEAGDDRPGLAGRHRVVGGDHQGCSQRHAHPHHGEKDRGLHVVDCPSGCRPPAPARFRRATTRGPGDRAPRWPRRAR